MGNETLYSSLLTRNGNQATIMYLIKSHDVSIKKYMFTCSPRILKNKNIFSDSLQDKMKYLY